MTTLNALQAGEQIRNWTVFRGYLGDTFTIAAASSSHVEIEVPATGNIRRVPFRDFKIVEKIWKDYVSGEFPRHKFTSLTFNSKYVISILRHLKGLSA